MSADKRYRVIVKEPLAAKFHEIFGDEAQLSYVVNTLVVEFLEEAEREDGTLDDVLTRIHERLQT
jgi:hypothetical protein